MLKEFPHLLNPQNNLKAIDYLNEWIKDADSILTMHNMSIEQLKQWKETVDKTYGLEQLVDLQAKVSKLDRLEFGETGSIDLTKLITISDLFEYDELGNIVLVNITPGNYEDDFEDEVVESYNTERIAITTPEGYLRGAMSFTGDDKHYLSGNGTWQPFPEISSTCIKKVTRDELIALRSESALIPGNWYRITDYSTIVFQENASSHDSGVDIIILASDANTLNENVYFTHSDTSANSYLKLKIDVNINAWRGKYCIDNNNHRFSFVNSCDTFLIANVENNFIHYIRSQENDTTYEDTSLYCWKRLNDSVYTAKNEFDYTSPILYASDEQLYLYIYTRVENPNANVDESSFDYGYSNTPVGSGSISSTIYDANNNPLPSSYIKAVFPTSKGVIYYLEDEFGNNAPYDFKNIVFYHNDLIHGTTFSLFEKESNGFVEASTLNSNTVYRNTINEYYTDFKDGTGQEYQRLTLNKIIMGCPCIDNYYGVNSHDIYIHGESRNNRWLGDSSMNTFTLNVTGNYFFTNCKNNTFTVAVIDNLFMGNCEDNNISLPDATEYEGYSIDDTPAFKFNTVGSNFTHNLSTMPLIVGNTIGNDFKENRLLATIGDKSNGSLTKPNVLFLDYEYNLVSNTVGNNVAYNTISGLYLSSLGNNIVANTIKRFSGCTIGSKVFACDFNSLCSGLLLEGNNTLIISDAIINNTRVSHGVSYLDITGNSLSNSIINPSVKGIDGKSKEIIVNNSDSITYYSTGGTEIEV